MTGLLTGSPTRQVADTRRHEAYRGGANSMLGGNGKGLWVKHQAFAMILALLVCTVLRAESGSHEAAHPDQHRLRRNDIAAAVGARSWVYLGANGELITPGKWGTPNHTALAVHPEGGQLLLLALDTGESYASVTADGTIAYAETATAKSCLMAGPTIWPFRSQRGRLGVCQEQQCATTAHASKKPAKRPKGATCWVLLGTKDYLITPSRQLSRPGNVLWMIPCEDGGFDLVHSGPLRSGVYLSVAADRKISYMPATDYTIGDREASDYWPWVDYDSERPVLPPPEECQYVCGHGSSYICYLKDGKYYFDEGVSSYP